MRLLLLLGVLPMMFVSPAAIRPSGPSLLELHNQARVQAGRPALREDPALDRAARHKLSEIERCGFAHDACGLPWDRFLPVRRWDGENIAEGFAGSRAVMRAWLASPSHRANVIFRGFHRLGVAHAGTYWVVEFSS